MIRNMNMPLPKALSAPAEFILNEDICAAIQADDIDLNRLKDLAEEVERLSLSLDRERLSFEGSRKINSLASMWEGCAGGFPPAVVHRKGSGDPAEADAGDGLAARAERLLHDRQAQVPGDEEDRRPPPIEKAANWVEHFGHLAQRLGLAIPMKNSRLTIYDLRFYESCPYVCRFPSCGGSK